MRPHHGRWRRSLLLVALVLIAPPMLALSLGGLVSGRAERPVADVGGVKQVAAVRSGALAVYDGARWRPHFWVGMNLGASTPGHFPGELSATRDDYLRWFAQMRAMNVTAIRIYTVLPPHFYEALDGFNAGRPDPLWLAHGIWSPEEGLIGADEKGRNAWSPEIAGAFEREIADAVRVVHGDADIPARPGHASGTYRADVSEYVLGWVVGTEWYPFSVRATDQGNRGMAPFAGRYFRATAEATPFESWMAHMLDVLAREEMRYGWQHPVSFTNWVTTDPLRHPNEPFEHEDMVSVDPMHVEPTAAWSAGYFAAYHVYPYYPDLLRFSPEYLAYETAEGRTDSYAGYLADLRAHHEGIPLVVAEYGLPSSRGMAHRGPLGRDQGMHTEREQGELVAGMLSAIHEEALDGAFLFAWHDEWFKFTWNTAALEIPWDRRDSWRNRLTNEEHFGVLAAEAGSAENGIYLDGETGDWEDRPAVLTHPYPGLDLSVAHDEAYMYLLLRKTEGAWNLEREAVDVGFGQLPGGPERTERVPGAAFPGGIQFLLHLSGADARLVVNSAYDQHTYQYARRLKYVAEPPGGADARAGAFLPWKLALSKPMTLPQTKARKPFEEIEVGLLRRGISDPANPRFDSLADWYAADRVVEVRIPWAMLGYTDPSSHRVWDWPYAADGLRARMSDGLRIYPLVAPTGSRRKVTIEPVRYRWPEWEQPVYHERLKQSYPILREAFGSTQRTPSSSMRHRNRDFAGGTER